MRAKLLRYWAFLLFIVPPFAAFGEGSRQLQPVSDGKGNQCKLDILDRNENGGTEFASYRASENERLHIHIKSPLTETLYFGLGKRFLSGSEVPDFSDVTVYYRIKDPQGNVVFGPFKMPEPGETGFINSYSEAVVGPAGVAGLGGYDALRYQPEQAGDYYIEFNAENPNDFVDKNFKIDLFDISVVNKVTNQVQNGRLWAKVWDLITLDGKAAVQADFYIYTPDGVISKVDYNGLQPWGFNVYANSVEGFKSSKGRTIQPEYKLFLNAPDPAVYLTGERFSFTAPTTIDCDANGYILNVFASKPLFAQVYLDLNGKYGYQEGSKDVPLTANLVAGKNQIPWDGKDGLGGSLPQGSSISGNLIVQANRINLPVHDAENHPGGFIVTLQGPYNNLSAKLYYDDTAIEGGTANTEGCQSTPSIGCHSWNNDFGNFNIINTWWYTQDVSQPFFFTLPLCNWQSLFIPEGYSPNGDNSHDTFVINGVAGLKVNIEIFNRWGNLVYKNSDYQNDWNGHSNAGLRIGDELPDGTYYYIIRLSDGRKFMNHLTLAR